MPDPQQFDFSKLPDQHQFDFSQLPDKPAEQQGQSHGWLLDNLWNAGERVLDIGKGILNASPMGQMGTEADAYQKLQQNPHAFDQQIAQFGQQLHNVTAPQYSSSLAMNIDPTGMVPSEVGLAKQIPSDIANKNYGGALVNAGLGALPFLHPMMSGAPKPSEMTSAPIAQPEIAPKLVEVAPEVKPQITAQPTLLDDTGKPITKEPTSLLEAQNQGEAESTLNQHTPAVISSRLNSIPDIANGTAVKPSPQQINSSPVDPVLPTDLTILRPGMATVTPMRDVGIIPAEINSFDTTLLNHPVTKSIYQPVVDAESQFISDETRATQDYAALSRGLTVPQLEDLGRTLNGAETADPRVEQVAAAVKQQVFEPLYNVLPEGTGKFEDYFPHVAAKDTDYYNQIKSYFLGDKLEPNADKGGPVFNSSTTASMETPFAKTRTDSIDNLEWNANKVVPLYIHSVLRDGLMSPAIDAAAKAAAALPDSVLKGVLGDALKNVTNFNGEGALRTKWNELANMTSNGIARSVYDGNIVPHLLHATNSLTQVYPELGEYYTAKAIGQFAKNPIDVFNEVTRNGLISGQQLPWNIKTGWQKFDSITNFGSFVEKLNAAIGYLGSKQRFIDQGMDEPTAQLRAMQATRKMNLVTTPATASKVLSSQSAIFGPAGAKIGGLGAKVPTKFVESLMQTALNAKENPAKFTRMLGTMGALTATVGPLVIRHAGTLLNANPLGAIGKTSFNVFSKAIKGDIPGAILAALEGTKYAIPGAVGIPDTIKFIGGD